MKLTKNQKKFINSNYETLSIKEISKKLNIKRKFVEKYLSNIGKSSKIQKLVKQKSTKLNAYVKIESFKGLLQFWKKHLDFLALATIVVVVVYANSLNGDFVSDDIAGIVQNPLSRNLWESIKTLNIHRVLHAVGWKISPNNPFIHHVFSVLFHILSVVFAFTAVSNIFNKKIAMISTILFALHPVNTESISWISGRGHATTGAFTFLALAFYSIYKNSNKQKYMWISYAVFLLNLITIRSPKVLAFVPILIIYDQFFYEKQIKIKKLIKFIPLILVSLLFFGLMFTRVVARIDSVGPTSPTKSSNPYSIRLTYSAYKTVVQLVFPSKLSLYHEGEVITQPMIIAIYLNFFILIGLTIWAIKKNRILAGLILMIFSSLLYMFSPYQVSWFIADRYLYIATFFFAQMITYFLVKIETKFNVKNFAVISAVVLSLIYSIRIVVRNQDWSTRKSLWESTAKAYPSSPRVYNNLGDVYSQEQDYQKSISAFEKSIELNPNYPDPVHNLGITYLKMGGLEKAEQQFKKALEMNPNLYQSYSQLALIEYQRKNYQQAIDYLNKALEINPNYQQAIEAKQSIQLLMAQ